MRSPWYGPFNVRSEQIPGRVEISEGSSDSAMPRMLKFRERYVRGEGEGSRGHLVDLVPAVLVLAADGGVLVEQELAAGRVASHHGRVVQSGQSTAVLVVWRRTQLQ